MKKFFLIIGLVILFVFSSFIHISLGYNVEILDNFKQPLTSIVTKEYLQHEPIYIDGNTGFTVGENGIISGNGTYEDPYLIKGWEINASNDIGIVIKNSDVYFKIDECFIHSGSLNQKNGVVFLNVSNGKLNHTIISDNHYGINLVNNSKNITISNCSIFYNNESGIGSDSYMISIIDNNVSYNLDDGITLFSFSSMNSYYFVTGNIISNNEDAGILLVGIDDSTFRNNIVPDNFVGFDIFDSSYNKIIYNNVTKNYIGINTFGCRNNTIQGNNITSSICEGIYLTSSSFNDFLANTLENNDYGFNILHGEQNNIIGNTLENNDYGFNISRSDQNKIIGNTIKNSSYRGLMVHACYENSIFENNFIKNKRHAESIGSYQNSWDRNYWDNWIGFKISLFQKFPKFIFGRHLSMFPVINFDWYPAKEPYDIPMEV